MTKKAKKTAAWLTVIFISVLLIAVAVWIAVGNSALGVTVYRIKKTDLPSAFDGYKIAQVSDLHNAEMGEDNVELLGALSKAEPDIIVVTGDLVDSRKTDFGIALRFLQRAVQIAPCYYVTGNHEARLTKEFPAFERDLTLAGVKVLRNEAVKLQRGGQYLTLIGLDDPNFMRGDEGAALSAQLQTLTPKEDAFTVLLAHRPEFFDRYAAHGADLVFSGHAHGGQFRFFNQGIYAPGQGLFPAYTAGVFTRGNTSMVVSRGIGNSAFPFRVNNPPELVLVELTSN